MSGNTWPVQRFYIQKKRPYLWLDQLSKGVKNEATDKYKNWIVENVFEIKVRNNSRKQWMKEISEGLRKVLSQLDDIRKQPSPDILIYSDTIYCNYSIRNHKSPDILTYHDMTQSSDSAVNSFHTMTDYLKLSQLERKIH